MSIAATMISPSFPFSRTHSTTAPNGHGLQVASRAGSGHTGSPTEPRRTSGDSLPPAPVIRQSLPSISEALRDPDFGLLQASQAPPLPLPPVHNPPPNASTSVSELHRRSMTNGLAAEQRPPYLPHQQLNQYLPTGPHALQAPLTPVTHAESFPQARSYTPRPPKLPSLHPIKTDSASPPTLFQGPASYGSARPSPGFDTPPQSAAPWPAYGHPGLQQPPPPLRDQQPPAPPAPPGSGAYFATPNAWPTPRHGGAPDPWNDERHGSGSPRPGLVLDAYGESVKRHLEEFDLEASLNELAECGGKMLDFTREYGIRNHGNQRGGAGPHAIPNLQLLDDLLRKNKKMGDLLNRIRDMVVTNNQAIEQQANEANRNGASGHGHTNGYDEDGRSGMGGFAGGDTKKRRGRAEPPRRCHSCNRAETPEWRRGPDGARTLCNACGLHYAKLTRKMAPNKATSVGGTNLKPKE